MSGICGVVFQAKSRPPNPQYLHNMLAAFGPSQPDAELTMSLSSAGFGAQRSIGDHTEIAHCTIHNDTLAVVFHGTLYNLSELTPHGDRLLNPAQQLLDLYVRDATDFLERLRGEFALAVWDGRDERLYLATDRFRVKPIFYAANSHTFVFASRIPALLASGTELDPAINHEAVVDVVASSIIPTPKTIFRNIKKLRPGHLLVYDHGHVKDFPYWQVSFLHPSRDSESVLGQTVRLRLNDAIADRLLADGTRSIGAFLSGGVDSSTVAALLTQHTKSPVHTFSIGFGEDRFNEIEYARITARAFSTQQHEYFVTPGDTYDALPALIEAFDEPYANASAVPCYFCAKMAREARIDVLYAGDGGDELFAGNERYATQQLFEYYYRVPQWLRDPVVKPAIVALAQVIPAGVFLKAKKYVERASIPYARRISSYDFFRVVPLSSFLAPDFMQDLTHGYDPYLPLESYFAEARAATNLDRHLYADWKITLSDNDLIKVTRASRAAGVSVRFPFLDERLVEVSTTIPAHMKMRGTRLRTFFKNAYRDILPPETRQKKKHGFGLPIPVWLRTDARLNAMMRDLVLGPRLAARGFFRKKALEELVETHKTDSTSFCGTVLWNIMILELWHRHAVDRRFAGPSP